MGHPDQSPASFHSAFVIFLTLLCRKCQTLPEMCCYLRETTEYKSSEGAWNSSSMGHCLDTNVVFPTDCSVFRLVTLELERLFSEQPSAGCISAKLK